MGAAHENEAFEKDPNDLNKSLTPHRKHEKKDPNIDDPEPTTFLEIVKKWPKSTFCIIGNEFCERFSYYGMRTVLTLYLINILNFSDNNATILFHSFTVLSYTSPLFGSILADGYIGKFWTIFSVSLLYAAGQIVLAVASTFKKNSSVHPGMDLVGLAIIALGTGGIKPCVSAFGGEQFKAHYLKMISVFFSVFYFMINAGSTVSTFLTPEFRAIPCNGEDSCFPLAFGVPAILMIVATVFFMLGSFFYKKVPPKENVIFRVVGTIRRAIGNMITSKEKRCHWLEYALVGHQCENDFKCRVYKGKRCAQARFVEDVKSLVRVTVMMLPVPMFWALYDQQGSRWIIQAVAMDAKLTNSFSLLPDQMGTLNAILIMVFIPIFQAIIYPGVEKLGIRTTLLRRMIAGGLLAVLSFLICGFVQLSVNKTLPDVPGGSTAYVTFVNNFPNSTVNASTSDCYFNISSANQTTMPVWANSVSRYQWGERMQVESLYDNKVTHVSQLYRLKSLQEVKSISGPNCPVAVKEFDAKVHLKGGKSYYVSVTRDGWLYDEASWDKPSEGEGQFAMNINLASPCNSLSWTNASWIKDNCTGGAYSGRFALCPYSDYVDYKNKKNMFPCNPKSSDRYYGWKKKKEILQTQFFSFNGDPLYNVTIFDFKDIKPGTYTPYFIQYYEEDEDRNPSKNDVDVVPLGDIVVQVTGMGGVYSLTISSAFGNGTFGATSHTVVPENHVSILWQIPQYVVITAAEILFSITGLEFAYSEASPAMKSVVQAIWLVTVAFGDLIIIIITELDLFSNLAIESFVYAGAMFVVIGVFFLLTIFYYEYAEFDRESDDEEDFDEEDDDSTQYSTKEFTKL